MRKVRGLLVWFVLMAAPLASACQNGNQEQTGSNVEPETAQLPIIASEQPGDPELPARDEPDPIPQQENTVQADPAEPPAPTDLIHQEADEGAVPVDAPMLVAEGTTEIGGGKTTVRVWLESGTQETDEDPGPFQGTYLYGTFEIEAVTADGTRLPRKPLSEVFGEYETITFKKSEPFKLLFDDYNADGHPDFTIGQWAGSNGNEYAMLTVGDDGVHKLAHLYSADHRDSIRYRKVSDTAFLNKYYDMETGYKDEVNRWQDGRFAADAPTDSQEISAAGVDEEK